nr:antifreeze protein Maxi-like [Setaria viridis]
MPSNSPITEDRAARTFASPLCTACHLPHSSASSSTKRGLCGSSRNLQSRVGPPHALGTGLTGTRVGAALAAPDATVPNAAAGVGSIASNAAGLDDYPNTCATVSIAAAGAAVPVPAAAAASVVAARAGVPASVAVSGAGVPTPATAGVSVAAAREGVPAPAAAGVSVAIAGGDVPAFTAAAAPIVPAEMDAIFVVVTGATVPISATAGAAGSSSASSSRSITSPVGGTPGATPCPAGSTAKEESRARVGPCLVPGCGPLPPVVVVEAASAVGSVVFPVTPSLAAGGVAARLAEVDDTRSAFFGASGGTKSRGVAL